MMAGVGQYHLLGCKIIRRIDLDKGSCTCPNLRAADLAKRLDSATALLKRVLDQRTCGENLFADIKAWLSDEECPF